MGKNIVKFATTGFLYSGTSNNAILNYANCYFPYLRFINGSYYDWRFDDFTFLLLFRLNDIDIILDYFDYSYNNCGEVTKLVVYLANNLAVAI